jgi:hypothetical protein
MDIYIQLNTVCFICTFCPHQIKSSSELQLVCQCGNNIICSYAHSGRAGPGRSPTESAALIGLCEASGRLVLWKCMHATWSYLHGPDDLYKKRALLSIFNPGTSMTTHLCKSRARAPSASSLHRSKYLKPSTNQNEAQAIALCEGSLSVDQCACI